MVLHFKVTGDSRKAMVKAIEKELGLKATYLRVPSCAYVIGDYTVGKNGELEFDNRPVDESAKVIDACVLATGISPQEWDTNANSQRKADTGADKGNETKETDGVTISVPRAGFTDEALLNLKKLVESKTPLMKKAFNTDELRLEITEDKISFPWFENADGGAETYAKFISKICEMAKLQKRITAKPKENENEKYAFRCFLLRLGFIGDEYKADRKILLSNLDGSSAFKSGAKKGGMQ